jgi:hypothetical protein
LYYIYINLKNKGRKIKMNFPIEKYRYYVHGTDIIAVSTYAGKTVRGVAKCDPNDKFDAEKGKVLAAARCNDRVAQKRLKRAKRKLQEAMALLDAATEQVSKMRHYFEDAVDEADRAIDNLIKIEEQMRG